MILLLLLLKGVKKLKKIKKCSSFHPAFSKTILIFLTVFLSFCMFCTPVYAGDDIATADGFDCSCGSLHRYDSLPNDIAVTVFKWGITIYDTSSLAESVKSVLLLHEAKYEKLWSVATAIYDAIEVVGVSFATIYFLLALIDKVQTDQFNIEHFFKALLKWTVTIIIISNGVYFLQLLMFMCDKLYDELADSDAIKTALGSSSVSGGAVCELYEALKGTASHFANGVFAAIGYLFELIIPYICVFISKILIMVNSYGRAIEFFVRVAFAPIGMAGLASGENNSQTLKYIKKLAAVGIQGALILVVVLCYTTLLYTIQNNATGFGEAVGAQAEYIILSFAVIGLLSKAQSWANDVLNV